MFDNPIPPVTVFAGKGGMGKTTCAAATALHAASQGRKTLAISTDATPSVAHIFDKPPATARCRCRTISIFRSLASTKPVSYGKTASAGTSIRYFPPLLTSPMSSLRSSWLLCCLVWPRSSWSIISASFARRANTMLWSGILLPSGRRWEAL